MVKVTFPHQECIHIKNGGIFSPKGGKAMNIKELRSQLRMTQKEFAEYFNIPQRTIENWESGKRNPPDYVTELIKYKIDKERLRMLKLIEMDHGKETILKEGYFEDLLKYLREKEEVTNWVLDEDPEMELPNLDEIETLKELELELDKIDLGWWSLVIKEV